MTSTHAFGTWSQQPGQPGVSIRIDREISEDEFKSHAEAINAYESLLDKGAFSLMQRSHSNVKMMVSAFSNAEKYGGTFRNADKTSIKASLMAELTNWLAATRLYLENERDFVLTRFGDGSAEMLEFKSAASRSFDEHEGYKFLYNLRDYTQHCGIPPCQLTVSGTPSNRIVEVTLDKPRLLSARFKWSKHARGLLEKWPTAVPLLPLMEDAMAGYAAVADQMDRIKLRHCVSASPLLLESLNAFNHSDGNPTLILLDRSPNGEKIDFSLLSFPTASSLHAVVSASEQEDPLAAIKVTDAPRPPAGATDGKRATAVLSTCFTGEDHANTGRVVNQILQADGGPGLLVSDLINTSMLLAAMLSQLLGSSPHAVLGRLVHDTSHAESAEDVSE